MDRRTAYTSRRTASSARKKRWTGLALAGASGLVLLGLLLKPDAGLVARSALSDKVLPVLPVPGAAVPAQAPAMVVPRRVYPYSIIPGGVSGRDELARVIKTDKVVAAHYASFAVEKAVTLTVSKPRAVYVSYRKGDTVYWTARKLMLVEGEMLLSDGRSEMRARCANRISDVPQLPVAPNEPTAEEFDSVLAIAMDPADDVSNDTSFAADATLNGASVALAGGQSQSARNAARGSGSIGASATGSRAALTGIAPVSGRTPISRPVTTPVVAAPLPGGRSDDDVTPGESTIPGSELVTLLPGEVAPAPAGAMSPRPDGPAPSPLAPPGGNLPPFGGEPPPGFPLTPMPPALFPELPPLPAADLPVVPGENVHELPEPATLGLFAAAFAAMLLHRRRARPKH